MPVKEKDLVVGQVYWVLDHSIYTLERYARAALRMSFYSQCQGYEVRPMVCVVSAGRDDWLLQAVDVDQLVQGVVVKLGGVDLGYFGCGASMRAFARSLEPVGPPAKVLAFKRSGMVL